MNPSSKITIKKGDHEWKIPRVMWESTLDRVATLAWISAAYHAPTHYACSMPEYCAGHVIDEPIAIAPDRFEYPVAKDAQDLLAHLKYFGVMTDFEPEIQAAKCQTIQIDERRLREVEKRARSAGRQTFQQVYLEHGRNIAPVTAKYTGLAGGMKYDADKRRLTFTLVTSDREHLWQDFMVEWTEDDFAEMYMLILDYNDKIPVWGDYGTGQHVMPKPTLTSGATDAIEDLLPQADFIHEYMLSSWGGRRANAGRKKETDQVSARVPLEVLGALKEAAEADGVSLSAKTAEILGDWAKKGKGK